MAFVIKNIRDRVVHVDGVPINPGQQLIVRHMTGPIQKALDVGDLRFYDGHEAREEKPADDVEDSAATPAANRLLSEHRLRKSK